MRGMGVVLVHSPLRVCLFRIPGSGRGSPITCPSFCFNKISKYPGGKSGFLGSVSVSGSLDFGILLLPSSLHISYMFLKDRSVLFLYFIHYSHCFQWKVLLHKVRQVSTTLHFYSLTYEMGRMNVLLLTSESIEIIVLGKPGGPRQTLLSFSSPSSVHTPLWIPRLCQPLKWWWSQLSSRRTVSLNRYTLMVSSPRKS